MATTNAINYLRNREEARSHLAQEKETNRSNLARERETHRSNLANEGLGRDTLSETKRSNRAKETETNRANLAKEAENNRHNLITEGISRDTADADVAYKTAGSAKHQAEADKLEMDNAAYRTLGHTGAAYRAMADEDKAMEAFAKSKKAQYDSMIAAADANIRPQANFFKTLKDAADAGTKIISPFLN